MKKIFFLLTCTFYLLLSNIHAQSPNRGNAVDKQIRKKLTKNTVKTADSLGFLSTTDANLTQKTVAEEVYIQEKNCVESDSEPCAIRTTTTDCTPKDIYCNNDTCIKKIKCCHKIEESIFKDLTEESQGFAKFRRRKYRRIVKDAICKSQYIICSIKDDVFYINRVNDHRSIGNDYETFYSVALMKSLYSKNIRFVVLYRGIQVMDDGKGKYILPFKIIYKDGSVAFYDVSDTEP